MNIGLERQNRSLWYYTELILNMTEKMQSAPTLVLRLDNKLPYSQESINVLPVPNAINFESNPLCKGN